MVARFEDETAVRSRNVGKYGVPSHEEVAARAHELFEDRGRAEGHDLDDWLQAENELLEARQEQVGYGTRR
jgi:hypothetical protein